MSRRFLRLLLAWVAVVSIAGCAGLPGTDPLNVSLAGIDSLPGEGMELRMAVKLRVQNPNDAPVEYDGVAVNLEMRGMDFASGVSDTRGTVPRYGESVITVPVTVSAYSMVRQAYSLLSGGRTKLDFVARGKLGGPGFGGMRFETKGEFELPAGLGGSAPPGPARN